MSAYSIVLFFHVVGVITLFVALGFEALSLFRLQGSSTVAEARVWIEPVPRLPLLTVISALVVLGSGIHMAARMSAFREGWVDVSILALLLMAPLGAPAGKRLRAIRNAVANATTMEPALASQLRDGFLTISLVARAFIFLGIVLLMIAKPELLQSIVIIACALLLGLLLPVVFRRRKPLISTANTNG